MDCTYRTDDLAQAHLLAGLHASASIAVCMFEVEFGNIHGGRERFRVMLPCAQPDRARPIIGNWKAGAYALDAAEDAAPSRSS